MPFLTLRCIVWLCCVSTLCGESCGCIVWLSYESVVMFCHVVGLYICGGVLLYCAVAVLWLSSQCGCVVLSEVMLYRVVVVCVL